MLTHISETVTTLEFVNDVAGFSVHLWHGMVDVDVRVMVEVVRETM